MKPVSLGWEALKKFQLKYLLIYPIKNINLLKRKIEIKKKKKRKNREYKERKHICGECTY